MIATALAVANPFPGLRSFEPEEDYLFFGREEHVDEILSKLRHTHFLSVVGGSGSGKSSLVRAGLIPALYGGSMVGSGSRWRVAMFRPGEDPVGRMAQSLAGCGLIDNVQANGGGKAMIEATLRRSSRGLIEAYQLAGLDSHENLLVLVDQFEELFRYRAGGLENYQDEAVAFVKLLLAVSEDTNSRLYVALTMRSDFIGNCADYPGLPPVVTRGQYLVPRMTRSEMRDAITGPIAVARTEIAPRLVVRLLNDAGEDPDQLPVLQHALMRTWDCWKRDHQPSEPMDIRHYEAIGTMAHALSLHADEAFAELSSERERTIAEKAFKALTQVDEQGRGVRRPTTLKSICEIGNFEESEVKLVIERFREQGRAFLAPRPPFRSSQLLSLTLRTKASCVFGIVCKLGSPKSNRPPNSTFAFPKAPNAMPAANKVCGATPNSLSACSGSRSIPPTSLGPAATNPASNKPSPSYIKAANPKKNSASCSGHPSPLRRSFS